MTKRDSVGQERCVDLGLQALLVLTACALACVRISNDPPGFQYLPPEPVRSTMWILAAEIQELERLLATPELRASEAQRTVVRSSLFRMREAARALGDADTARAHPILDRNLAAFQARIERAARHVDRDPPSYAAAASLAGACFACHGASDALVQWPRPKVLGDDQAIPDVEGRLRPELAVSARPRTRLEIAGQLGDPLVD